MAETLRFTPSKTPAATKEFEEITVVTPYDHPIPDGVIAPPLRTK